MPQIARIDRPNNNSFILPVQIQVDGLGIKTEALYDTGADIYLSVNPKTAIMVVRKLGGHLKRRSKPLPLEDYQKKSTGSVTLELVATLELDGRRFPNQRFLVIENGYDIFID